MTPIDADLLAILLLPILGGVGLAATGGVLGCFIVWRRMAYFGDTLAHSSLLGIALGSLIRIQQTVGVIGISLLVAGLLTSLQRRRQLADDTLLGIISHGSLALGLIVLTINRIPGQSLHSLLLGDIVTLNWQDVTSIYTYSTVALALVFYFWPSLTSWVIDEDLAKVEGHPVNLVQLGLMLAIALFIALSIQFVGVLLITSLLITPAASARLISRNPEHMAIYAVIYGMLSTLIGILAAGLFDWPLGPSIVLTTCLGFIITLTLHRSSAKC